MSQTKRFSAGAIALVGLGLIILATGLFMLAGGIYLIALGGSWYFAPAGLGLLVSGTLIARWRPAGAAIYMLVFAGTVVWALWEVGFAFWPLVSRLFAPAVLAFLVLLLISVFRFGERSAPKVPAYALAAFLFLALGATVYGAFQPIPLVTAEAAPAPAPGVAVHPIGGQNWPYWGRTPSGTRFAPLDQITPANVAGLQVAWTYRTGEIPRGPEGHVVTPLHVNGMLYGCTQSSQLFALDAETGEQRWRFDPHASGNFFPRCRGVGYHDASATASPEPAGAAQGVACTRRIIATTVDARLVAVDALTGEPCAGFGNNGIVDLRVGMGEVKAGFYFPTAAPTVVRNLVVVGGLVRDNAETNEPSGVVRAFDVRTGALVWAWDLGNPAITALPPEGEGYTRGTPNVWSTPAFDDVLGLIYLPTGNATPDFWAGHRTEAAERYSSSTVALDIATGSERWHFQTVHHDLWDYDVPSQPALYDVPDGRGGTIPALIQTTKRGQIFMLDRRDGKPIAEVQERPVPQDGGVADDRTAPTQPYSVGMPAIGTEPLSEARMWGTTLIDQLVCRIGFRKARYEGEFTPPGDTLAIQYPGWTGGMNWGSTSIAENLGYLIVNDIRMGIVNRLIPRAQYDGAQGDAVHDGSAPQNGTPWGVQQSRFLSPLAIPCQAPPYGTITAIDLATRKIVWSMPIGTVQDTGPLGIPMHLQIPIGMPTIGGPVTTSSGLVFIAATQDYYIRAFDVRTGRELWKGRLPVGAEATPMTYVSPRSGRQFVVISAGGNRATTVSGDYIIGFALPK